MHMRSSTPEAESAPRETAGHLSDADLLRMLDGEPSLSTVHDVTAHLRACPACAARAGLLRERRRRLASLLAAADATVPAPPAADELLARARRRGSPHARSALRAAAVLLIAGTLAAQPAVRRWMGEQWHRAAGVRPPAVAAAPVAPASVPQAGASGATLSFEPGAGPFTIQFDARPTAGTLTIAGDDGTRAAAERIGGANLELLVMPHGLHVRNASGAAASYLVRVPRSVKRVHVRFGAAPTADDIVVGVGGEGQRTITFDTYR
jgi:hypothetical protein